MKITITIPDKLAEAFEKDKGSVASYLNGEVIAKLTEYAKNDLEQKAVEKAKAETATLVNNLAGKINVEVTK